MAPTGRISPTARRALRLLTWRARRPLAALCAGLAVVAVVGRLSPPDPPTVEVPVAARDLQAGDVLGPADVDQRPVPPGSAPRDGPGRPGDLTGRPLLVAVPQGLPLVPELLADDAAVPPAGTVVVPVRFADAGVAALLRPGVRVDVVAAPELDGDAPERLARGAVVLSPAGGEAPDGTGAAGADAALPDRGGGLLGGSAADVPVLLAVQPDEAVGLGAAASSRVLGAVIVG